MQLKPHSFGFYHKYHYTAPVPVILALYEAMRLICEETLDVRIERHLTSTNFLQKALELMGCTLYAPAEYRLGSVVAITPPKNIKSKDVIDMMLKKYSIEIAGSFGLDIFRIGQMGEQCRLENVHRTILSLSETLMLLGADIDLEKIKVYLN